MILSLIAVRKFNKVYNIFLKKFQKQQKKAGNKCGEYCIKCIACLVSCFERFIAYLSKNAYTYVFYLKKIINFINLLNFIEFYEISWIYWNDLDRNDLEKLLLFSLGSFPDDYKKPFEILCDRFLGRSVPIIWRRVHLCFNGFLRLWNHYQCRLLFNFFEFDILANRGKKMLIS